MPTKYFIPDLMFGQVDLEDAYVTDAYLVDQFVGNGIWSFGGNGNGQLGLGDTTSRSSPVQVGTLTNWKQVSSGSSHMAAVKTDGILWSWSLSGMHKIRNKLEKNARPPIEVLGKKLYDKFVELERNYSL